MDKLALKYFNEIQTGLDAVTSDFSDALRTLERYKVSYPINSDLIVEANAILERLNAASSELSELIQE